jgi:hypothetical protein
MKKLMLIVTMLLSLTLSAQSYTCAVQKVSSHSWNSITKKYTTNWEKDFPRLTAMFSNGTMYVNDDAGTSFTTTKIISQDKVTWTGGVKETESHFITTDEEGITCSLFMTYYSNTTLFYVTIVYKDLMYKYTLRPLAQ